MEFSGIAEFIDVFLRGMVTLSGLGLIGLTLIRTNARGQWSIVGLECKDVFDPRNARHGEMVSWLFGIGVFLVVVRCLFQAA